MMTVEELIEELRAMPPTAIVYAIQYEDLEMAVEGCDYISGRVVLVTESLDDPREDDGVLPE